MVGPHAPFRFGNGLGQTGDSIDHRLWNGGLGQLVSTVLRVISIHLDKGPHGPAWSEPNTSRERTGQDFGSVVRPMTVYGPSFQAHLLQIGLLLGLRIF